MHVCMWYVVCGCDIKCKCKLLEMNCYTHLKIQIIPLQLNDKYHPNTKHINDIVFSTSDKLMKVRI